MGKKVNNIYRDARISAGLTQEQASERLFISVKSLSEIENDKTKANSDLVNSMIDVYKTNRLTYLHFKNIEKLGNRLPSLAQGSLSQLVLKLLKEIRDIKEINDSMISIACDNEVSEEELSEWNNVVLKEIEDLAEVALSLLFENNVQKEKATDANSNFFKNFI